MSTLHKKIRASSTLTVVLLLFAGNIAWADTTATQRIFPMDCVFNEVNDGIATYTFLTPAACGVFEPVTNSSDESAANNTGASGGAVNNSAGNSGQNNIPQLLQTNSHIASDEKGRETTPTIQPTSIHNDAATKATTSSRYEKIITFSMVGVIILLFGWHFILARKRRRRN